MFYSFFIVAATELPNGRLRLLSEYQQEENLSASLYLHGNTGGANRTASSQLEWGFAKQRISSPLAHSNSPLLPVPLLFLIKQGSWVMNGYPKNVERQKKLTGPRSVNQNTLLLKSRWNNRLHTREQNRHPGRKILKQKVNWGTIRLVLWIPLNCKSHLCCQIPRRYKVLSPIRASLLFPFSRRLLNCRMFINNC